MLHSFSFRTLNYQDPVLIRNPGRKTLVEILQGYGRKDSLDSLVGKFCRWKGIPVQEIVHVAINIFLVADLIPFLIVLFPLG